MSTITTHVLDLATGRPAQGVATRLERREASGAWKHLADRTTDPNGRIKDLMKDGDLTAATYRLTFETGAYFATQKTPTFLPEAAITFEVQDPTQHHHIPLLLSPYGFSTYRGS